MPYDDPTRLRTITEMAVRHEVTLRTLRFYETRGLLSPLRQGTVRLYSFRDEIKLKVIQKGKRLGFSLAEIERFLSVDGFERSKKVMTDENRDITRRLTREQIGEQLNVLGREHKRIEAAIDELRRAYDEE